MTKYIWEIEPIPMSDKDEEFIESIAFMQRVLGRSFSPFVQRRRSSSEALARAMQAQFRKAITGLYLPRAMDLIDSPAAGTGNSAATWSSGDDLQPVSDLSSAIASMKKAMGQRPQPWITGIIESNFLVVDTHKWVRVPRSFRERMLSGKPSMRLMWLALSFAFVSAVTKAWLPVIVAAAIAAIRPNRPAIRKKPVKITETVPSPDLFAVPAGDGTHVLIGHPATIAVLRSACLDRGMDLDAITKGASL